MGAALFRIDEATPPPAAGPCALVVGNFDGVHLGHQAVLREAVGAAKAASLGTSVLTFDPHPAAVVGSGAPPRLTTLERRTELMGELGVDSVFVRKFDAAFAAWLPEQFVRDLVVGALRARVVVVGQNFRFGAKRAGDLALLRKLGAELGFDVRVHATASDARGPYSSTRAREAIAAGDVVEAARVLGRPHALSGPVIHGDHRGRSIGFPTANLEAAEMLPADGVYKTRVDGIGPAVTNVGVRPTVGGGRRTVETYLLDFDRDLYGANLRVDLLARIRGEQRFGSLDELKAQIARDVAAARS
ncbi:MAG TPA: bifunctional riboflavin kinase/FAD synthetase [Polyangiaceae bacterium]